MDVSSLIENVGASATGSIISKLVCYPLDTIAVQCKSSPSFSDPSAAAPCLAPLLPFKADSHILIDQTSTRRPLLSVPLRAYYRGIGVTILTVTPATAIYLTTREAAHNALLPRLGDGALNDA